MINMKAALEVNFLKDLRNNYMVIEKGADGEYASFCIKMLERQEIDGLLGLEQKLIDNKSLLYYDITARQSIKNILEKRLLSVNELRTLCLGIIQAVETAYEYLLSEDDFVLAPDFIFQDLGKGKVFLCLYPGYSFDIKEQMGGLMEFLMNRVDYRDKEAVYLVYRLYAVCKEEGYTLGHLKEALYEKAIIPESVKRMESRAEDIKIKDGQPPLQGMAPQGVTAQSMAEQGMTAYGGKTARGGRSVRGKTAQGIAAQGLTVQDMGAHDMEEQIIADQDMNVYERTVHGLDDARMMQEDIREDYKIPVVLEKLEGEEEIACYSVMTYLMAGGCLFAGIAALLAGFILKIVYNPLGTRIDYSKLAALVIILGCVESYLMSKLFDKKRKTTRIVKTKEYIDPRLDFGNGHASLKAEQKSNFIRQISGRIKLSGRSNESSSERTGYSYIGNTACNPVSKESDEADGSSPTCLLNSRMDGSSPDDLEINSSAEKQPAGIFPGQDESVKKKSMPVLKAVDSINYKDIPVTCYPFFIGKLKKNVDFHLDSDTVSRYHAKITKEGDSFFITDLNSTNGTFINDELLQTYQKKEIKYGDIIAFANIRYRFAGDPEQELQELNN